MRILVALAVLLLLAQAVAVHRERSRQDALIASLREQARQARMRDGVLLTSMPPAMAFNGDEPLGLTPVLLPGASGPLTLKAPGYQATVPASRGYRGDPATAPAQHVALSPTLGPLSPLLFRWPLATAGLLCALGALALHLRRPTEEALPEVTFVGPGGRIGRYRLDRLLGTGGMAEVYLDAKADAAVKVLNPEASRDPETRQRLEREFGIASGLAHRNIVRVLDSGEQDGRLFLAMEYVGGGTLRERIPSPWRDAVRLAAPMADALAYAHARGVVHRDLKPENVLLDQQGIPRVADFGLARATTYQTITATGSLLGTPAYIAPEQISTPKSDPRADVYSLGCILYELLSGRLPFPDGDLMQTLMSRLSDAPPPLQVADVPKPLEDLVMRMLAQDPADRPADAAAVREALKDLG